MCERNSDGTSKTKNGIDKCLHKFISILNKNDINTVFSCCGHGSESPSVIVANVDDVKKLLEFMDGYSDQFIIKIEPFNSNRWTIVFNGLVCNPLRYPSWVDSKDQVNFIKEIRIQIGL